MTKNSYSQALLFARLFLGAFSLFCFSFCKKEKKASIEWIRETSGIVHDFHAICVFKNNDTLVAAGGTPSEEGVISLSADAGASWKTIFSLKNNAFFGLHFLNSNVGFAFAEFLDIYKTTDGGKNWIQCTKIDTVEYRYRVKLRSMKSINAEKLFVVGGNNFGSGIIMASSDSGNTWRTIITVQHELRDLQFISETIGFASGYGIVLKTTDAGINWAPTAASDDFFTAICFTDNSTAFISGYNGNILKSADSGENWKSTLKGNSLFARQRVHFNTLDFFDSSTGLAAGENGYALLTNDGGTTWKASENEEKISIQNLRFKNAAEGWAVGDDGALFKFKIN